MIFKRKNFKNFNYFKSLISESLIGLSVRQLLMKSFGFGSDWMTQVRLSGFLRIFVRDFSDNLRKLPLEQRIKWEDWPWHDWWIYTNPLKGPV